MDNGGGVIPGRVETVGIGTGGRDGEGVRTLGLDVTDGLGAVDCGADGVGAVVGEVSGEPVGVAGVAGGVVGACSSGVQGTQETPAAVATPSPPRSATDTAATAMTAARRRTGAGLRSADSRASAASWSVKAGSLRRRDVSARSRSRTRLREGPMPQRCPGRVRITPELGTMHLGAGCPLGEGWAMMRTEGDELVARARAGDEAAWAELYGDHAERLVVWLDHLHHADPAADAEDIAAEAWLTAARKVGDFRGDRGEFAGWLFGIARNISRSRYRTTRGRRTTPLGPSDIEGAAGPVADPAREVVGSDLTRRLVALLPEREAQVVACIDVVGLDASATSAALGISTTAVRVAHHRGLRRLRRRFAELVALGPEPDVTLPAPDGM